MLGLEIKHITIYNGRSVNLGIRLTINALIKSSNSRKKSANEFTNDK